MESSGKLVQMLCDEFRNNSSFHIEDSTWFALESSGESIQLLCGEFQKKKNSHVEDFMYGSRRHLAVKMFKYCGMNFKSKSFGYGQYFTLFTSVSSVKQFK